MPVSHSHRCIFVHVPKTAGISVMRALAGAGMTFEYAGAGLFDLIASRADAAELVARWRRSFPVGTFTGFPQQHLPADILQALLPRETWDAYWKFAVVRNPWEMVVSTYFYQRRRVEKEPEAATDDLSQAVARCDTFAAFARLYPALRSDMSSLLDVPGGSSMDFVARVEHLDRDIETIGERLGVSLSLPRENASEHGAYREYYDDETRAIMGAHFARDIERFGYRF
jgi:hypothetical protein